MKALIIGIVLLVAGYYLNEMKVADGKSRTAGEIKGAFVLFLAWPLMITGAIMTLGGIAVLFF